MDVIISMISAGGLVGATNQYAFVLLLSVANRLGWIDLGPGMAFTQSWVFIGIVAFLWVLLVAPSYISSVAPGIVDVIDNVNRVVHSFVIPASAAFVSLASLGMITNVHPELDAALQALRLTTQEGNFTPATAVAVAGSSATIAVGLMGTKAVGKRSLGAATGLGLNPGWTSLWATLETVLSVVIVGLIIVLTRLDPRLIIALLVFVSVITLGILIYSIYLLYKLARGVGRVFRLVESHPKAGWAIITETFVWGGGALMWNYTSRGATRMIIWGVWLLVMLFGVPSLTLLFEGLFAFFPPLLILPPLVGTTVIFLLLIGGVIFGLQSGRSLMRMLEVDGHISPAQPNRAKPSTPDMLPASN